LAAYISVPRDLTKVKSKVAFNLTKRQLLCFGTAALIGVPLFFVLRDSGGNTAATLGMMAVMLPAFFLGMYEKNGQPMEKLLSYYVQSRFVRPKIRPYKTNNYYALLLLKEEQTAAYSVEIWKRFRKWGGIPTGLTQNVKDLLSSREVENIFENSDMIIMLNQAAGDRQILAKQLNISPHQLSYVTHSGEGEGLLFFGNVILPFVDRFPTDLELYRIMTTKLGEVSEGAQK